MLLERASQEKKSKQGLVDTTCLHWPPTLKNHQKRFTMEKKSCHSLPLNAVPGEKLKVLPLQQGVRKPKCHLQDQYHSGAVSEATV